METGKIIYVNFNHSHYYIRLKELKSVGLILPKKITKSDWIAIDQIKDVHIQYNINSQQLLINVPFFWFPIQKIFLNKKYNILKNNLTSQSNFGWLFNYNIYFRKQLFSYSNPVNFLTFWSELRIFSKWGVLSNTSSWSNELSKPSIKRYDTHLEINDEKHLLSYILGDSITDTLFGSIPLRIGGIKFFRNFSLYPDIITYPLPKFFGQTDKPSRINLYINHSKMISTKINPGPFILLNTIPNLQGSSKAKMVILSPKNEKKIFFIPFYVTSELLKPGLTNFSFSLGLLRERFGMNYRHLISSGIISHGIKSWLTLEAQMERSQNLLKYGIGATIKPMTLGVVNLSWIGNNIKKCFHPNNKSSLFLTPINQKMTIGYNYNNTYLSLSALHSFINYNRFSKESNKQENNLIGTINFGHYGNLSLGLINTWNYDKTNRLINLSYSITLPKSINLWASVSKNNHPQNFNAQFMFTLPLKVWGNTSFSSKLDENKYLNFHQIWSNKILTHHYGEIGWNVILSQPEKYHEANVRWKTPYFENRFGFFGHRYKNENTWIEFEGSVVNIAKHIYVTQPIHDAFALISTKGYNQIPVFYENQLVGKTNKFGFLLVPTVTGLYQSKFDIDPMKLPADVIATETTKKLPIKKHSGYFIEFDIHKLHALLCQIVDEKGNYLPNGSLVKLQGISRVTWLGWDGQMWLEGIPKNSPQVLTIIRSDNRKTCNVKLNLKKSNGILNLGKQVCQ
ncbi:MAG: fimbria/pilus outer membrane usher protein [Candidatus Dasytiphilus stammeri]